MNILFRHFGSYFRSFWTIELVFTVLVFNIKFEREWKFYLTNTTNFINLVYSEKLNNFLKRKNSNFTLDRKLTVDIGELRNLDKISDKRIWTEKHRGMSRFFRRTDFWWMTNRRKGKLRRQTRTYIMYADMYDTCSHSFYHFSVDSM